MVFAVTYFLDLEILMIGRSDSTSLLRPLTWLATAGFALSGFGSVLAQSVDEEFFENKIRPVLVENCYGCHNSQDEAQADLALDWKGGIRASSANGTAVVPFKPEESLLLSVVNHELKGLEMPEDGAKLSAEEIANLTAWIAQGAVDPRAEKPNKEQHARETSWAETFERRRQWWSLQPLNRPALPDGYGWSDHPIDRFVNNKLRENNLQPAPAANRRTLLRRLSYALTGLPPTQEEIEQFVTNSDPRAYEKMVDTYLGSARFGEHWARHWMDLVRYADSHGSEGDPAIPNIYQYRDYLIRALNKDVAYDQLVREHIAGDLLAQPRVNQQLGINESAIGPAHFRLVFHGFAPTDALDEKVRFTDDQINVLGKAFQGLTISCARCHDHKFDAISQADYYALFGVLGSCRPAMNDVNQKSQQDKNKTELTKIKGQLKLDLVEHWLSELDHIPGRLRSIAKESPAQERSASQNELIQPWQSAQPNGDTNAGFVEAWSRVSRDWDQRQEKMEKSGLGENQHHWDLSQPGDYQAWFPQGNGLAGVPSKPGDFSVAVSGDHVITAIYPAGVFSNSLSTLHRAVLGSPAIHADQPLRVWFQLMGGGQSSVRYVVQDYPRNGTVYPIQNVRQADWYWHSYDMKYWTGDDLHFELVTSKDAPLQVGNQQRSWFGVRKVMVRPSDQPAPNTSGESVRFLWRQLKSDPPKTVDDLARRYQTAIREAIQQWSKQEADDETCLFLNACVQLGLLANSPAQIPETKKLLAEYRRLESEIPDPLRVPGVAEAEPRDQRLLERGDHKQPLDPIPRRFLTAIDARPFGSDNSGRLELASALTDPANPLTARVISNRLWHWLFGQGIVATPDNFGKLGELPSHPELLDFLATRLIDHGWSMKQSIRFIVMSKTWQQSSESGERAGEIDPANRLLSHANLRRLSAEAIRDSLLFVSGQLVEQQYGPGFAANRFSPRRSVYIRSNRNSLDAFLQVFDAPVPFATTGRRSETNVPAQSLTLMNDPQVIRMARLAGQRVQDVPHLKNDEQRRALLFRQIVGRPCTADEANLMSDYYESTIGRNRDQRIVRSETEIELERVNQKIGAIIEPARDKLMKKQPDSGTGSELRPIARWDFSKGLHDLIGGLPGKQVGEVVVSETGLKLGGKGFVMTDPLPFGLSEKTLEAWVQVDDLAQQGGGVFGIQDLQGGVFDALVLGEQQPGHWLAGSDNFRRTERLGGPAEAARDGQPVIHMALVYDSEGTIRAYRNGKPYGKAYRKGSAVSFASGQSQLVFGLRHGKQVADGRMFRGNILEARLYDRALTAEELQSSSDRQTFVSHESILQSLTPSLRTELQEQQEKAAQLTARLNRLPPGENPREVWTRLSHALFNLKEFIFIE